MACYRPIYGWQRRPGEPLVFGAERKDHRRVDLACGYCIGCRLVRSRAWAIRCMHEVQLSNTNSFLTLTYDDKKLTQPGLVYQDFQNFMRVLRRRIGYFDVTRWQWLPRYFMCGEYGDLTQRPHFHAILFGTDFADKRQFGTNTYRSPTLEKIWPHGYSTIGEANYETAGYVARYSTKKVYGPRAAEHYRRILETGEVVDIKPEFAHMSLKPGIGFDWFKKYWKEVTLARDGVIRPGGKKSALPRYYMKLLMEQDNDLHDWRQYQRYINSKAFEKDCTPERLAVREQVTIARLREQIRNKV